MTATIFEQRTAAQEDATLEELLPAFWVRPTTGLHSLHWIAVSISHASLYAAECVLC